jgi:hypothetical protein
MSDNLSLTYHMTIHDDEGDIIKEELVRASCYEDAQRRASLIADHYPEAIYYELHELSSQD